MNVITSARNDCLRLGDLTAGTVFRFTNGDDIYMKTTHKGDDKPTFVSLITGWLWNNKHPKDGVVVVKGAFVEQP